MGRGPSLEDDVSAAFARACEERDWLVAEFLFQALEAIAKREGDEGRMEEAFGKLFNHMMRASRH